MNSHRGTIYLVGAGPGDPDLITVRGMRLIEQADTIIHDRLIPKEVLQWARPDAKLIDVGKYPDHHRIKQPEINDLLVPRELNSLCRRSRRQQLYRRSSSSWHSRYYSWAGSIFRCVNRSYRSELSAA